MLADRKLFAAFLRSFGENAQEAGLSALAGGLPGIVFYELLRQAAPALWGSKQGAIVRSETDISGESKQAGLPAPKEKPASRPANVVNLMEALRRSVEGPPGKSKTPSKKAEPAKKEEAAARPKRKVAKG